LVSEIGDAMRVLVVSDLHGNVDALERLELWRQSQAPFDAVWVLGDLVDYGGDPAAAIEWTRRHATLAIRGNHDHAMATGEGCGSSPEFLGLSVATREHFRARLTADALGYLGELPLALTARIAGGVPCHLTHASPGDPLFGYLAADAADEIWREQIGAAGSPAFLFVGHTHQQFTRRVDGTTIVNPGSLGLPTDGDTRAAFAVFEAGSVQLHRVEYDVTRALARTADIALDARQRVQLDYLYRFARVPRLAPEDEPRPSTT
jgi:predicted phosphodiesterase